MFLDAIDRVLKESYLPVKSFVTKHTQSNSLYVYQKVLPQTAALQPAPQQKEYLKRCPLISSIAFRIEILRRRRNVSKPLDQRLRLVERREEKCKLTSEQFNTKFNLILAKPRKIEVYGRFFQVKKNFSGVKIGNVV